MLPGATLTDRVRRGQHAAGRSAPTWIRHPRFHGFLRETGGTIRTIDHPRRRGLAAVRHQRQGPAGGGTPRRSGGSFEGFVTDGERVHEHRGARGEGRRRRGQRHRRPRRASSAPTTKSHQRLPARRSAAATARSTHLAYRSADNPHSASITEGEIVGAYDQRRDGRSTELPAPTEAGASRQSTTPAPKAQQAARINDRGSIVGVYSDHEPRSS